MGHEAVFHARTMGYKCVFTGPLPVPGSRTPADPHEQAPGPDPADCNHVVCVSHTAKENTVLRSGIHPERVSVIPNAVDAAIQALDSLRVAHLEKDASNERVVVAVTARLAYRKGVHLLAAVIPLACERHPELDFLIAGDGPMREHLERTRDAHGLGDRVTLLGDVPHARWATRCEATLPQLFPHRELLHRRARGGVLRVPRRGDGRGGGPEVLPPDILFLAEPNAGAVADALSRAAETTRSTRARGWAAIRGGFPARGEGSTEAFGGGGSVDPVASIYERVAGMYSWDDVAERVERVYERAHATEDTALGLVG